jgi:hypothetical protein
MLQNNGTPRPSLFWGVTLRKLRVADYRHRLSGQMLLGLPDPYRWDQAVRKRLQLPSLRCLTSQWREDLSNNAAVV